MELKLKKEVNLWTIIIITIVIKNIYIYNRTGVNIKPDRNLKWKSQANNNKTACFSLFRKTLL